MHRSTLGVPYAYAFQPIVSLKGGGVHHVEALIRPAVGGVDAALWIKSLERSGEIVELDRRAVMSIAPVADKNSVPIAVNLSAITLDSPGFIGYVDAILRSMDRPRQLCFEITETRPIARFALANAFVLAVQEYGCEVALDDYGCGFMDESVLRALRADSVKIDMSVVHSLECPHRRSAALRCINQAVEIAATRGATLVAEGIETEAMEGQLKELGATFGQGYYYGKPAPLIAARTSMVSPARAWGGAARDQSVLEPQI